MVQSIINKLECFNDSKFKFDPKLHKYTYEGNIFESVTKFIENFHKPFDQELVSKRVADKLGVEQSTILKEWKETNRVAIEIGTGIHEWIELYYNKKWQEIPNDINLVKRINKFNIVYANHLHKLEPIKFEVRVFSKKWKIAGTIDSLFLHNGKIYILDWKSNKSFTDDDHPKGRYEKLLYPFDSFYKNHHNEYSIQLSMYALILEEWGFEIGGVYIVYIGPDDEDAKILKAIDMRNILKMHLNKINE